MNFYCCLNYLPIYRYNVPYDDNLMQLVLRKGMFLFMYDHARVKHVRNASRVDNSRESNSLGDLKHHTIYTKNAGL